MHQRQQTMRQDFPPYAELQRSTRLSDSISERRPAARGAAIQNTRRRVVGQRKVIVRYRISSRSTSPRHQVVCIERREGEKVPPDRMSSSRAVSRVARSSPLEACFPPSSARPSWLVESAAARSWSTRRSCPPCPAALAPRGCVVRGNGARRRAGIACRCTSSATRQRDTTV